MTRHYRGGRKGRHIRQQPKVEAVADPVAEDCNFPLDLSQEHNEWFQPLPPTLEEWFRPTEDEVKRNERALHIDMVHDLVPFWIRGVQAAQNDKELKLEQFLEELYKVKDINPWAKYLEDGKGGQEEKKKKNAEDWSWPDGIQVWGDSINPAVAWGQSSECPVADHKKWGEGHQTGQKVRSTTRTWSSSKESDLGQKDDRIAFIEQIINRPGLSQRRRQEMYSFYNVCIPSFTNIYNNTRA